MKNKLFLFIVLASVFSPYKTLCSNPDTLYCKFIIDLNEFYSVSIQQVLKEKIYNAAADGKIKAYVNDSLITYYPSAVDRLNEVSSSYPIRIDNCLPAFYRDTMLYDSYDSILQPFTLKDIHVYSISFKVCYDQSGNYYKFIFNGFSLQYDLIFYGNNLGSDPLFYVSKDDLLKILEKDESTVFFTNCYKAFLNSLNSVKK